MPAQFAAAPSLPSLRAWRARRHLSQQALADAAGISARAVARVEQGWPTSARTAARLADALGVTVTELQQEPAA